MLEHWYQALNSPVGVCIRTSGDRERTRAKLYKARADACDLALEGLSLVLSPTAADEIWIVKREPSNGAS